MFRVLICLVAGVLAGVGAIGLGRAEDQIGPFTVSVATTPSAQGITVMDLDVLNDALDEASQVLSRLGLDDVLKVPDEGIVSARTHSTPLLLRLTITRVDPARVQEILPGRASSVADLLSPLKTRLTATMARLAVTSIAIGAAGGLVLSFLFRGRIMGALAGLTGGAGAPAAIFVLTGATYDLDAFRQPLEAAAALLYLL